jgi:hypothetical protein
MVEVVALNVRLLYFNGRLLGGVLLAMRNLISK